MFANSTDYDEVKNKAWQYFQDNSLILSKSLGEVFLNSEGFTHLIFKGRHHPRPVKDQLIRFSLIKYIRAILTGMSYYQEYTFQNKGMRKRYWGFIAIVGTQRIKIIIKQEGTGPKHFWSIFPCSHAQGYKDFNLHE